MMRRFLILPLAVLLQTVDCFVPPRVLWTSSTTTELSMVFDFFRERTTEGLDQLGKLADASYKGKLIEGFQDLADYTAKTNAAFANGLAKSRDQLKKNLEMILTGGSDDMLEDLLDVMLQADLGMATAEDVVKEVKSLQASGQKFRNREDLISIMRGKLIEALDTPGKSGAVQFSDSEDFPTVLFVMGANGMGKTTTIGKLAHRLRTEGNQTVLMAACDTFRAGAVEQLEQWATRAEVDCFSPSETATSPAAVLYGALDKAIAEKYDTLLVDTSGRLSNNEALTAELAKMKKVIQKRMSIEQDEDGKPILNTGVPHETLIVIDAAQGRMALDSAKVWDKEIGLSGLILTKLDGSARGGSVVAVTRELGVPVKLIGVGEGIEDLRDVSVDCDKRTDLVENPFTNSATYSLSLNSLLMVCWELVKFSEESRQTKAKNWLLDYPPCERSGMKRAKNHKTRRRRLRNQQRKLLPLAVVPQAT